MEENKYNIFVSYSRRDIDRVRLFVDDIHAKTNANCWVDWSGIEIGSQFTDIIIKALDKVDMLLFILSDNSMSSEFVKKEITYAMNTGKKIIPVVIDGGKLRGWFLFEFGQIDYIDIDDQLQYNKLIGNLSLWYGEKKKSDEINGHKFVDLGLPSGLKWATCNVGAAGPEYNGEFFAWGETESRKEFTDKSYSHFRGFMQGYTDLGNNIGASKYDAATKKWGGTWRLPTIDDFDELLNNCVWEMTVVDNRNGYKITGKTGNSIFLPVAGYRNGKTHYCEGKNGHYWSASPDDTHTGCAFYLYLTGENKRVSWGSRGYGRCIRPVADE